MQQSLSEFFSQTDPATLDNCDQEQIHLSGQIQNAGALIVVDPLTQRIIGTSENIATVLKRDAEALLDQPISSVDTLLAEQLADVANSQERVHEILDVGFENCGVQYDAVSHRHDGRQIVEFLPNYCPSASNARQKMRLCGKANSQILAADSYESALQLAVDSVREITGFARVKIYRFLPDESGEVLAESNDGTLPSFLGLHFPERDIPKQVRSLMKIVPYRSIASNQDDNAGILASNATTRTLDLSWSLLRSVSPMHTAYLRNMNVASAFSASLLSQGELWGLFALHHTEANALPFDYWGLIQDIGATLMLRFEDQQRTDISSMTASLRRIENAFASQLRKNHEIEEVIKTHIPVLQQFLQADGFAFKYGHRMYTVGKTPPTAFISELLNWSRQNVGEHDQFQTHSLHSEWPDALEHKETACGVLIQPVVVHRVCQLIWFRRPVTQKVLWAGNPDHKRVDPDNPLVPLTPRESFETWIQEHSDQSLPWRPAELQVAREIFQEFLDIIASQILLKDENASLRHFAEAAAHDLKSPLQGIRFALNTMREEGFEEAVVRETHSQMEKSANRLGTLTDSLLELAVLREQQYTLKPVNLSIPVSEAISLLSAQIHEHNAEIRFGELTTVQGSESLLIHLFLNLIANSIKYRDPDRSPVITIETVALDENTICLAVDDNGIGVSEKFAEKIFEPLSRLHSASEIEGSGLGLNICSRIVEIHQGSISLDTTKSDGARFLVTLARRVPHDSMVQSAA